MSLAKNLLYTLGLATTLSFVSSQGETRDQDTKASHYFLQRADITVPIPELISMYTDCDQKIYDSESKKNKTKSISEVIRGVGRRTGMEKLWDQHYNEEIAMNIFRPNPIDTSSAWHDPLNGKGWFENSFDYPRYRERRRIESHEAIDIFVKEGTQVYAPVGGVVIAAADDWEGFWTKRRGFHYLGGGLNRLSGNGVILFSPHDTSYYFLIHLKDVDVKTGDIVSGGDSIGTVGRTGNASSPWSETHLHIAKKETGTECGIEGVLVPKNIFYTLVGGRKILLAQGNTTSFPTGE